MKPEQVEPELIPLTDAQGQTHPCVCIDRLTENGVAYVALIEPAAEDDDYFIMRVVSESGEGTQLVPLTDEAEFERICAQFDEHLDQLYGE